MTHWQGQWHVPSHNITGESVRLPCADGWFGEAEHVGAFGVLGAAAALVGRELAVGVDFSLEALEELLACWAGAGAAIVGATPREFGADPTVDAVRALTLHGPRPGYDS